MNAVEQFYSNVLNELADLKAAVARLESKGNPKAAARMHINDFCRERGISKPTVYSWEAKGFLKSELVGGRRFILLDTVSRVDKFQREPALA